MAIRGYGREESYRGGNKIYGSGRNSPHVGTKLDPSGYVDRELNKSRVQKRSRLAQAALLRFRGNMPNPWDGKNSGPNKSGGGGGGKGGNNNDGKPKNKPKNNNNNGPDGGGGNNGGNNNNGPPGGNTGGQYQPPKVDLNGKLLPMPWDMQMDWINATTDLANQNASWDSEVNQANTQLGMSLRDMARQKITDSRELRDQESSRGMAFSSGNANNIANMENDYAMAEADTKNYVQDLLGRIGIGGTDRAMAQGQYEQYASLLQAEAARQLAERAGTLGLGKNNNNGDHSQPGRPKGGGGPRPKPRHKKGRN